MTPRPHLRHLAAALVLLTALGACSVSRPGTLPQTAATDSSTTATSSPAAPTGGKLSWHSCGKPMQCATLQVPLDWSTPGKTISLYLSRKPAGNPSTRIGSLVFNFGGPGVSGGSQLGQYVANAFDTAAGALSDRFDLVSWDPRGTGRSIGVDCTTKADATTDDLDPTPDTPEEIAAATAKTQHDTDTCLAKAGATLPYIDTWSTVRDLDAIRAALGDDKLSYVGFSYGTELGMSYLQTFPSHVRAMVLDGIDLPQDAVTASHDQAVGFEQAVGTYLADCQSQGSSCPFGNGDPAAAFDALRIQLDGGARIPATAGCADAHDVVPRRSGSVGIGELDTAVGQAMYDKSLWPLLSLGLARAARASKPDGSCLLVLRDLYNGIQPDGSLDHLLDSFHAISCADQPERAQNPLGDRADLVAAWSKELPRVGGQFAAGLPGCWRFPVARHPLAAFQPGQFAGAPPVALVGNTGDPATPYSHALTAASLLTGSALVTWDSTEHTVFLTHDSSCIDDPLVTYLLDLTVPKTGLICKP